MYIRMEWQLEMDGKQGEVLCRVIGVMHRERGKEGKERGRVVSEVDLLITEGNEWPAGLLGPPAEDHSRVAAPGPTISASATTAANFAALCRPDPALIY